MRTKPFYAGVTLTDGGDSSAGVDVGASLTTVHLTTYVTGKRASGSLVADLRTTDEVDELILALQNAKTRAFGAD